MKRIMGIDPGTDRLGYGVIDIDGADMSYVAAGIVKSNLKNTQDMLNEIWEDICTLIKQYDPDEVSCELVVFVQNQNMIRVIEARGAVIIAVSQCGKPLFDYTPTAIKSNVTGNGRAKKKEVQEMVRVLLNMDAIVKPDDAADALAIAITHRNHSN